MEKTIYICETKGISTGHISAFDSPSKLAAYVKDDLWNDWQCGGAPVDYLSIDDIVNLIEGKNYIPLQRKGMWEATGSLRKLELE